MYQMYQMHHIINSKFLKKKKKKNVKFPQERHNDKSFQALTSAFHGGVDYSHFHNTLKHFDVLPSFTFAAS